MTDITFSIDDGRGRVTLHCGLILDKVSLLKEELVKAIGQAEQITVDLGAVKAVDVAGLQFLCACHRFAAGRGKTLQLAGVSEPFQALVKEVGFSRGYMCHAGREDSSCMWARLS